MEPNTNIIYLEHARKRRKIQKFKSFVMKPTVLALFFVIFIYSVLFGGYLMHTENKPVSGLVDAKVRASLLGD